MRQPIEIDPDGAVRVEGAGKGEVVRHLHEELIELLRVAMVVAEHVLEFGPFFPVLFDEFGFAHAF